ncbi:MAG: transposase [Prolixibacteraceae bacterium]
MSRARYYDRTLDNDPDRGNYALTQIGKLYAIEKKAREKGLSPEEIFALRQKEAVPVLSSFKQWLDGNATYLLPQSRIGEAFTYTLKLSDRIMNYTTDGALFIDNAIENSIRPAALGRCNYMFAGCCKRLPTHFLPKVAGTGCYRFAQMGEQGPKAICQLHDDQVLSY